MNKFFTRGLIIGMVTTLIIGGVLQWRLKTPQIMNYRIIYAEKGDTLTSICQKNYSSEQINKFGMNTLRDNCLEETPDGILKIGERILVPVYKN